MSQVGRIPPVSKEIGKSGARNLEVMAGKGERRKASVNQKSLFVGSQLLKALFAVCGTRLHIRDCNSRRASERRGLALGVSSGGKLQQATAS
jgi:hypothetical protein